jgi:hypothetical protein
MTHQGWDVQFTAYAARDWRANFFPIGIAHSVVGASAWEPTPWAGGAAGGQRCAAPARRWRGGAA